MQGHYARILAIAFAIEGVFCVYFTEIQAGLLKRTGQAASATAMHAQNNNNSLLHNRINLSLPEGRFRGLDLTVTGFAAHGCHTGLGNLPARLRCSVLLR